MMIEICGRINGQNLKADDTYQLLDTIFEGKLMDEHEPLDSMEVVQKFGTAFVSKMPKKNSHFLSYIANHYADCHYANYRGRVLYYYILGEFFSRFPLGEIFILHFDDKLLKLVWDTEQKNREYSGIDYFGAAPLTFSGLQEENFIYMALNVLSFSIYPIYMVEIIHHMNYTLIFVPDRGYKYSQLTGGDNLYNHLSMKFFHILNDEWTFDSSRGAKSSFDATMFNPVLLKPYFEWYFGILDKALDILFNYESTKRQQAIMTLNGMICDMFFSTTSEIQFLSKHFFFSFIDKAANFISHSNKEESVEFQNFFSEQFLNSKLKDCIKKVPGILGSELVNSIEWAIQNLESDSVSSSLLRNIRNSQHGYMNNEQRWESLLKHTGQISNDIVVLLLPFWLYILESIR